MNMSKKTRILVVEDDSLFLWSLNHFLKKEGYDVCSVASGEAACDMAQEQPFDILISDFHLPGLNGKELIKKVKALQPEAKTILISAYQREETGNEEEALLNAYLNKPIEMGRLKSLLQDLAYAPQALST
jgi:DNA-binding NtrC family response regulator